MNLVKVLYFTCLQLINDIAVLYNFGMTLGFRWLIYFQRLPSNNTVAWGCFLDVFERHAANSRVKNNVSHFLQRFTAVWLSNKKKSKNGVIPEAHNFTAIYPSSCCFNMKVDEWTGKCNQCTRCLPSSL